MADVIRVLEGPLASVRGIRPDQLADDGVQEPFVSLWVAVRVSLRSVLEEVTLADLAGGSFPRRSPSSSTLQEPGTSASRLGAESWCDGFDLRSRFPANMTWTVRITSNTGGTPRVAMIRVA